MALENPIRIESFKTATDLSAKQFYIMKLSAARTVAISSAVTDRLVGPLLNKPTSGVAAAVAVLGPAKAIAGAAITAGALLTVDSAGKVVTAAAAQGVNNMLIGYALEAAAADGDIIEIWVQPGIYQGA